MRQTWRWFGPGDPVCVDDMLQAGVEGVVSALHQFPAGAVWPRPAIEQRQAEIAVMKDGCPSGAAWEVVECLPVSEDIKTRSGAWREHIANYKESLRNLAAAGIEIVCYNFMPVLDWTRTDVAWRLPHGGTCMRFDMADFAAFDLHVLERPGAQRDVPEELAAEAARRFAQMCEARKRELADTIVLGLPGSVAGLTLEDLRARLADYRSIDADRLRRHLVGFLEEVAPLAADLGIRVCCHPDDPPYPLLGLPRIMSTEDDYAAVMQAVDVPANGITLCSGSLGVRPDNDLPGMMARWGGRVHFLHLRNVKREAREAAGSFHEAEHLGGDTDMVALVAAVLREETRRKDAGRADWNIPMRPDHGHNLLDDLTRRTQPGYPAIGRLRGLAELRGVAAALGHPALGLDA